MSGVIVVRFTFEGFHAWPEAPERRSYLRDRHRHLFHAEVALATGADREVEFHDLLDFCRSCVPGPELGSRSCEAIAQGFIGHLTRQWPGRYVRAAVFEDGEAGAVVDTRKEPHG